MTYDDDDDDDLLYFNQNYSCVIGQVQFSNVDTRPLETRSNIIPLPRIQYFNIYYRTAPRIIFFRGQHPN